MSRGPTFEEFVHPGSRQWIADALKRITYKPGVKVSYDQDLNGEGIRISMRVIDVHNPGVTIAINVGYTIPRFVQEPEELFEFVLKSIGGLEDHERFEWFEVDGKTLIEPHPELVSGRASRTG